MSTKPKVFLNEEQIIKYCNDNNIDTSICYCKDCGKLIAYDGAQFHINSVSHKLVCEGKLSFLTTREYNGNTYNLCRCYDCVCEKFPEFKNVRFKFAHKAAKYTQYGFDVPDEDFKPVSTARQAVTREKMIKKYGLNEGEERWNEYCKKQSETNTFEYKNKKYGMTRKEFNEYNDSRSITLNNLINRWGIDEGTKKWNEYIDRQRYTTTKEYFIEKYGEDIGLTKYIEFCDKRASSIKVNAETHQSNISIKMFDLIYNHFKNNIVFYNQNEYKVKTLNNVYFTDYYDQTNNIVIEFYGTFWHMDPSKYDDDFIMLKSITAKEKREKDKKRIEDIQQSMNCKVIVVWESTYRSDKQGTVEAIITMIENKDQLQNITYI